MKIIIIILSIFFSYNGYSIIDNNWVESFIKTPVVLNGNNSFERDINYFKIYEAKGDSYIENQEVCYERGIVKSTFLFEDKNIISVEKIKNFFHLNVKNEKITEEIKNKISIINKKITLHGKYIDPYIIIRRYRPVKLVNCEYSKHFIVYSTDKFSYLINLEKIENQKKKLEAKYDLKKELNEVDSFVKYLYDNEEKITIGSIEVIHYGKMKNKKRNINLEKIYLSDINDIVRMYKYDKKELFEYSIYLDTMELIEMLN